MPSGCGGRLPTAAAALIATCGIGAGAPAAAAAWVAVAPRVSPQPAPAAVLGRTGHVVVLRAGPGETAAQVARRAGSDADQAWRVTPLEGGSLREGAVVAVSLDADDAGLAAVARYVPVLCYHRFTAGRSTSLMEVGAANFEAQLGWLRDNGYTVVPLSQVADFVNGRRLLPPRTVAITIDDGYRSAVRVALPLLKRFDDPVTLFVYTDFVGAGEAVGWEELQAAGRDPLVDIQSHSKTHRDMVKHLPGETAAAFAARRRAEVADPVAAFRKHFPHEPGVFGYPFGSTDLDAVSIVARQGYKGAATVARGGNAPWTPPYLLRRDMIYGTDDIATFARRIRTAEGGAVAGPAETEQ